MDKKAKSILIFSFIAVLLASLAIYLVTAASFTATLTPTNVDEDGTYIINFTINNTSPSNNISVVHIQMPTISGAAINISGPGNGTSSTVDYTTSFPNAPADMSAFRFTNTSATPLIAVGENQSFWINITDVYSPGTSSFLSAIVIWDNGTVDTNYLSFKINDKTPPSVALISPANATFSNIFIHDFNCNATDNGALSNITIYVWNSTSYKIEENVNSVGGSSAEAAALSVLLSSGDGVYNWNCRAGDSDSNYAWNSANGTLTIDSLSPLISIVYPASNGGLFNSSISINYTVSDLNLQACWWTNNSGLSNHTIACGTNITGQTWSQGSNTVTLYTNDSAGNLNLTARQFNIDTSAPVVTLISPASGVYNNGVNISLFYNVTDASGNANCTVFFTGGSGSQNLGIVAADGSTLFAGNLSSSDGLVLWNVSCFDAAHNTGVSAARNYTVDTTPPQFIGQARVLNPDIFFSPYDSIVNISVNISDATALTVIANLSNISSTLNCGNGSNAGLTLTLTNGLYQGSCNISTAITNQEPQQRVIVVVAADSAIPPNFNATALPFSATPPIGILVHNMGVPQMPAGCQRFGNLTTNFTEVLNFSSVNFIIQMEMNGSCLTGPGGGSPPWQGYEQVMMLNFSSLNMSDQAIGQKLSGLQTALQVNITPPHEFGITRIYVNETAFAELNTNTTITLNNLPFASNPTLVSDNSSRIPASIQWTNRTPFNITVLLPSPVNILVPRGDLQFSVGGFSGYNTTDTINPTITIHSPIANQSSTIVLVNVTVNGTITQPSEILISGLGTTYKYNSTYNSANCTEISPASDAYNCLFSTTLPDASYTLAVNATDYGGLSGNTNSTSRNITVDSTAPSMTGSPSVSPANGSSYISSSQVYQFNVSVSDGSGVGVYKVIMTFNGTNYTMGSAGSNAYTNSSIVGLAAGTYAYSFWYNDTLGNAQSGGATYLYTVSPAAGAVSVYINGTNSGITIANSTQILLNATLLTGTGLVTLYNNGMPIANNPFAGNLTNFTSPGLYNITAVYLGNNNYTAAVNTLWVNSIDPTSTTIVNSTSMTVNQTVAVNNVSLVQNITVPVTVLSNQTITLDFSSIALSNGGNVSLGNNTVILLRTDNLTNINYSIVIPANDNISGGAGWDGKIIMPIVNTSSFSAPSGSANVVIDVGTSIELNFSNPVKIVVGGMTGKKAAWSRGSTTLTDISTQCNNATNPTNIANNGTRECYYDDSTDLIIWTYHFTSFAAYTPSTTTPPTTTPSLQGGGSVVSGEAPISGGQLTAEGITKELKAGNVLNFDIGTAAHSLTVLNINSAYASIKLQSAPITATINKGETNKFDLDGNGEYDTSVYLQDITVSGVYYVGKFVISFIGTAPPITPLENATLCGNGIVDSGENCGNCAEDVKCASGEKCQAGVCVKTTVTEEIVETFKKTSYWVLITIIAVVIIAVIIALLRRKKKEKPIHVVKHYYKQKK